MRIARTFTLIAALLALAAASLPQEASAAQTFTQWVERFWPVARAAGIKRETYDRAFKGMTPDPKVIEAANFQPEYVKPIGEYIDRVVSEKRIAAGKQKLEENKALLDVLEKRYGVDRTIIVAIWGLEFELRHAARRHECDQVAGDARLLQHQGELRPPAADHGAQDRAAGRYPGRADERLLGRRHGPHAIHPHHLSKLCRRL